MRRALGCLLGFLVLLSLCAPAPAADAPLRSTDPRIKIELFAESPQIKTPTGIDVDALGRVWAIECNTHFRPPNYDGHPSDRLLILTDKDGDGRCETVKTFADGFQHAMSVAVRPVWMDPVRLGAEQDRSKVDGLRLKNGKEAAVKDVQPSAFNLQSPLQVFLATRRAIFLLEDNDGDDVCDQRTELAWLETKGDYPHNGLAGIAFDALGWMYFGFGENLGAPYVLKSREMGERSKVDGLRLKDEKESAARDPQPSTLNVQPFTGEGEGGNLYRMRPDGTQLSHWATGFWNPHASCVDAFGRLFTVDNDPDSRPPCRLVHIMEGGDYGYRFRNGRKGLHPFTAWNGEIPGTLPMAAGTGEAPSGILAYEHDALPEDYLGRLFVTSWGDHRIDTFVLKQKGASFESVAQPLIVGGENFRPVGIALAPDGSVYCTDWVLRDYKLHGQGRVWRISAVDAKTLTTKVRRHGETAEERLKSKVLTERRLAAKELDTTDAGRMKLGSYVFAGCDLGERMVFEAYSALGLPNNPGRVADPSELTGGDPFLVTWVMQSLLRNRNQVKLEPVDFNEPNWAVFSRKLHPQDREIAAKFLQSSSAQARRVAVQWAAEEGMKDLRPQVEAVLKSEPMTTELFLATLAALEMLDGKPPQEFDKTPAGKYVLPLLKDDKTSPAVKVQALRLVSPADPALDVGLLTALSQSADPQLQLEAVRSLALCNRPEAVDILAFLATTPGSNSGVLQSEAILGLASAVENPATRDRAEQALVAALRASSDAAQTPRLRQLAVRRSLGTHADDPAAQTAAKDLRGTPLVPGTSALPDDAAWRAALATAGEDDPAFGGAVQRGRIAFFHPNAAGCSKCHTVQGRGGKIGPDLSRIGGTFTREKLIDSILEPSREISPQFTNWSMISTDGKVYAGMIVDENEGKTVLGQSDGQTITLKTADVEERTPQTASVMPEKLEERLTVQEFRDLLAFLQSLK